MRSITARPEAANAPLKPRSGQPGDRRLGLSRRPVRGPDAGKTLTSFSSPGGIFPGNSPTLSGSTLYGTTFNGGPDGRGTVFGLPASGGTPTTLGTFSGTDGSIPYSNLTLTLSGSTLYGTDMTMRRRQRRRHGVQHSGRGGPAVDAHFVRWQRRRVAPRQPALGGLTLYGLTEHGGAHNFGTAFAIVLPEPSSLALLVRARSLWGRCTLRRRVRAGRRSRFPLSMPARPQLPWQPRVPVRPVNGHGGTKQETAHEPLEIRSGAAGDRFIGFRRRPSRCKR